MLVLWTKAKQIITYEENVVENPQEKNLNLRAKKKIMNFSYDIHKSWVKNCKLSSFSLNANVARF